MSSKNTFKGRTNHETQGSFKAGIAADAGGRIAPRSQKMLPNLNSRSVIRCISNSRPYAPLYAVAPCDRGSVPS